MFKSINNYIKEVLKDIDPFFVENASDFFNLSNDYLKLDFLCSDTNFSKVSGIETLKLVRDYLDTIGYKELFDEEYKNGTFTFLKEYEGNILSCNYLRINEDNIINVPFEHNIMDGVKLIHEFFHLITSSNKINPDYECLSDELISIYFEMKYLDYLKENDYNKDDILKAFFIRFDFTKIECSKVKDLMLAIDIYNTNGKISEEVLSDYEKTHKNVQLGFTEILNFSKDKNYLLGYNYILGTTVACYFLDHNINANQVFNMIYSIDKMGFTEQLCEIGCDTTSDNFTLELIESTKKIIKKLSKDLTDSKVR